MSRDLFAALLGLLSAASWGAGDFTGGLACRRAPVLGVLVAGQAVSASLVALAALGAGEAAPPAWALGWAVGAGVAGGVGLGALFRGLAVGRMGVVAPVSAVLSAAIPVVVDALGEGLPPPAKLLGFGLAAAGVWLVAAVPAGASAPPRSGLGLALLAGLGFGAFLVLMHRAAAGGTWWPLAAARATTLGLALGAALALRRPPAPPRAALPVAALSGVFDAGGNACFVLASQAGRLDVAAVLSSLYPASTVALAALLLGERPTRRQGVGLAAVLAAIALIAR